MTRGNAYGLRFEPGNLPPVGWFWSLTLYDTQRTAMYPNPLEGYSIGDSTEDIKLDGDGSLTVTIRARWARGQVQLAART